VTSSPAAYAVARTLVGYDCLGSNANAVDLICEYFDFTPGVHYYLFNQGYYGGFVLRMGRRRPIDLGVRALATG
jgi:hypothetical protein